MAHCHSPNGHCPTTTSLCAPESGLSACVVSPCHGPQAVAFSEQHHGPGGSMAQISLAPHQGHGPMTFIRKARTGCGQTTQLDVCGRECAPNLTITQTQPDFGHSGFCRPSCTNAIIAPDHCGRNHVNITRDVPHGMPHGMSHCLPSHCSPPHCSPSHCGPFHHGGEFCGPDFCEPFLDEHMDVHHSPSWQHGYPHHGFHHDHGLHHGYSHHQFGHQFPHGFSHCGPHHGPC